MDLGSSAPVANRFFAAISTTGSAPRNLNPDVYANGYQPWLNDQLTAAGRFGALSGVWINPGGNDGGDMDADQIPSLAESGDPKLVRLADQFPAAAREFAAAFGRGVPYVYFGCLLNDASFDSPIADGRPHVALRRLFASYLPAFEAGLGVICDKLGRLSAFTWQATWIELLRRVGVRVGCEALPAAAQPGETLYPWSTMADVVCWAKESFYQRNKSGTGPNRSMPVDDVVPPIIRYAHSDEAERRGLSWATMSQAARCGLVVDIVVGALANGDCAAAPVNYLVSGGVSSMSQLEAMVQKRRDGR